MPKLQNLLKCFFISIFLIGPLYAQQEGKYIAGTEKQLQMVVHIFGEVRRPGEYTVLDNTNLLELVSKAGGPTQYSNLGGIKLTRVALFPRKRNGSRSNSNGADRTGQFTRKRIYKIDLSDYLNKEKAMPLPVLQPGDVVFVPRNRWFKWRNVVGVARDLSVIASVYFIYLRATRD